jgi:hypothetical protein
VLLSDRGVCHAQWNGSFTANTRIFLLFAFAEAPLHHHRSHGYLPHDHDVFSRVCDRALPGSVLHAFCGVLLQGVSPADVGFFMMFYL